jgi:hypothetical protein
MLKWRELRKAAFWEQNSKRHIHKISINSLLQYINNHEKGQNDGKITTG